ncbi:MAG: threo-3-hydroxy-L-aspartate ammonia-lyase [Burkholderiaceae bacterium]
MSMNEPVRLDGLPIGAADIRAAAQRLAGVAHRTPVLRSRTADASTRAQLFFKCENLQRVGAFKFRGAYNALASLSDDQRRAGVVAFSSGNHAQAVALAARELGVAATIVMPADAPAGKLAATRGYGAEVVIYDRYREDRAAIASRLASERGLSLIPPVAHPQVMAGQGTAALELFEEVGELDELYVCLGGGGLLSGCAVAAAMLSPRCQVIGVEPEAGDDVRRSLAQGRRVSIEVPRTIADGAQTQSPGELTFAVISRLVARVDTVSDAALVRTMRWFAERMKLVVEPTGCLAAAAAMNAGAPAGRRIGIIISGGNVDIDRYAALLAGAEAP